MTKDERTAIRWEAQEAWEAIGGEDVWPVITETVLTQRVPALLDALDTAEAEIARLRGPLAELCADEDLGIYGDKYYPRCCYCGADEYGATPPTPTHTPECLVTRARAALLEPPA